MEQVHGKEAPDAGRKIPSPRRAPAAGAVCAAGARVSRAAARSPSRRDEIATYEGRFEFWDADTETAWVMCDPTGFAHEGPSQRLAGLSPVDCRGTRVADRVLRCDGPRASQRAGRAVAESSRRTRRSTCIRGVRGARAPEAWRIGAHDHPDVVLEVDNTTGRPAGEARSLRGVGIPRGLGGGSRGLHPRPPGRPGYRAS